MKDNALVKAASILGTCCLIGCCILALGKRTQSAESGGRYKMEIVTDKGKNWNGIYVIDSETGRVHFYVSPESF